MSTEAFQPQAFVITYPSPGYANKCHHSLKSISLLDDFQDEIQTNVAQPVIGMEYETQQESEIQILLEFQAPYL